MTLLRERKVANIANDIAPVEVYGPPDAPLLLVGWGSTFGAIRAAARRAEAAGLVVAHAHLRHLNPFPLNLGEVLARHDKVLVPELNRGQLAHLLRAEYLVPVVSYPKVQGLPFKAVEIFARINEILEVQS
jgi:2-oxoglutarate ferredoxin oxidoreductase subunit alpha